MWSLDREALVACGVCASVCGDCSGDTVSVEVCQDQRSRNATTTPLPFTFLSPSVRFISPPLRSYWGPPHKTQTALVLFLPLCGGGGGETVERERDAIKQRTWGWAWSPPLTPATAYRVMAAPAPPPGPMNFVSIFCLFCFWFKKRKTKGWRQGLSAFLLSGLFCMNERAMGRIMCAGQLLGFWFFFYFFF